MGCRGWTSAPGASLSGDRRTAKTVNQSVNHSISLSHLWEELWLIHSYRTSSVRKRWIGSDLAKTSMYLCSLEIYYINRYRILLPSSLLESPLFLSSPLLSLFPLLFLGSDIGTFSSSESIPLILGPGTGGNRRTINLGDDDKAEALTVQTLQD